MTDFSDLIGPKPPEVTTPRFPTPWHAVDGFVYDANDGGVARVETETNQAPNSRDVRAWVAQFITEAVNEKIARDAAQVRYRAAWEKYEDDPTFTFDPIQQDAIATAEEAWKNATEPGPAIQAFIDGIRVTRGRELDEKIREGQDRVQAKTLHGYIGSYRADVEYWRSKASLAFYRLTPEARGSGKAEAVDTYYTEGIAPKHLYLADLSEDYVREDKTPCSVLDVPEDFRL